MNKIKVNHLITDKELKPVANVFYGSKYVDSQKGTAGNLSKSYSNISTKCGAFDNSTDGLISTNDPNYSNYKNSQFYQSSNPANKLNAFLWYYVTGRLDNAKYNTNVSSTDNKVTQMKNLACQVLQDKAVSIDYSNSDTTTCDGSNIFQCSVGNIFSNSVTSNKTLLVIIFLISTVLFIFGTVSLMKTMYKFFELYHITSDGILWMVWNIFGIIIGFIVGSLILIYSYTTAGTSTENAPTDSYVFIPPTTNSTSTSLIESFSGTTGDGTCLNGDTPVWGCCDDQVTHKIDPLGSNCCPEEEAPIGGCASTQYGCCPDSDVAKIDAAGSNCTSTPEEGETIGGCSGTRYGCCPNSTITKSDIAGTNCTGCANTTYGCCDYPNNTTAKIDAAGSNCDSSSNTSGSTTLVWFIVLILLSVILFILFTIFNKNKLVGRLLFAGFIICTLISLNLLFGIIQTDDNSGLIVKTQINTNMNVFSGFSGKNEGILFFPSIIIFVGLLALSLFLENQNSLITNIFKPLSWSMLGLSFVVMFFSIYYIWYSYPVIFGILIFGLRFLWNTILTLTMKFGSNSNFVINMNALLYEYPLQYFMNMKTGGNGRNIFTKELYRAENIDKVDLPTGLPWDIPGVKLIKILLLALAQIGELNVPDLHMEVDDIGKSISYPSSNINVFSWIPFLKSLIP